MGRQVRQRTVIENPRDPTTACRPGGVFITNIDEHRIELRCCGPKFWSEWTEDRGAVRGTCPKCGRSGAVKVQL